MLISSAILLATDGSFVRPVAFQDLAFTFVVANALARLHRDAVDLVEGVTAISIAVILVFLNRLAFSPAFRLLRRTPVLATGCGRSASSQGVLSRAWTQAAK